MIEELTQDPEERSSASGGKLGLSHAKEVLCPFCSEEGSAGIVYLAWILKLLNPVWEVKCWDNCQKPKTKKFHRVRFKHSLVLQVLCVLPVGLCVLIWYLTLGACVTFNRTSHFLSRENWRYAVFWKTTVAAFQASLSDIGNVLSQNPNKVHSESW